MCCLLLVEFTREITDTQMVRIAPILLPQLYRIFVTTGQYSNRARSRAVVIFTTCVNVIIEISEVEKVSTALTCRVYYVICCMVSSLSCLIEHVNIGIIFLCIGNSQ